MPKTEEPGVLVFRLLVVLYALCLPGYLYYRFAFTIEGLCYQTLVCVLESYGEPRTCERVHTYIPPLRFTFGGHATARGG